MEHKIIVVGIGPGAADYIAPLAMKYIVSAAVLVGSQRALQTFGRKTAKMQAITGDIERVLQFIRTEAKTQPVVVMVSGDPGYYSLLAALRQAFGGAALLVIPGISSLQLAFARLALPWQQARLLSLHGREPRPQDLRYEAGATLGILTDTLYTSRRIARVLLEHGWPKETQVSLCTRLSYEDEEIITTTLDRAVAEREITHCIMVVIA